MRSENLFELDKVIAGFASIFALLCICLIVLFAEGSNLKTSIVLSTYYFIPPIVACLFYLRKTRLELTTSAKGLLIAILSVWITLGVLHELTGPHLRNNVHFNTLDALIIKTISTDEVFHATLINSIKKVGFTSTSIDGYVFVPYHALTHYFDAVVVKLLNLNFFDIQGMASFAKTLSFCASIIIFSLACCKTKNSLACICFIATSFFLIFDNGNVIGSHPYWAPSTILILSWPVVLPFILKGNEKKIDLIFLMLFVAILGFGKISLGLVFASIFWIYLLIRTPRNIFLYLSGTLIFLFFLLAGISLSSGASSGVEKISPLELFTFSKPIFLVLLLNLLLTYLTKQNAMKRMTQSSILSFLSFLILCNLFRVPIGEASWFFNEYRLFLSLLLLTQLGNLVLETDRTFDLSLRLKNKFNPLQIKLSQNNREQILFSIFSGEKLGILLSPIVVFFLITLMFLSINIYQKADSPNRLALLNVYPFDVYNSSIEDEHEKISIARVILSAANKRENQASEILFLFRKKLNSFSKSKNEAATPIFFEPVLVDSLTRFFGKNNLQSPSIQTLANSLALSAFLDRPILNGVPMNLSSYAWGIPHYKNLSRHLADKCDKVDKYIRVSSLTNPEFVVVNC